MKRGMGVKAKIYNYWSIFIPTLLVTTRIRSRIEWWQLASSEGCLSLALELGKELSHQESAKSNTQVSCIKRNELRWLKVLHLAEVFHSFYTGRRTWSLTQDTLDILCVSGSLGIRESSVLLCLDCCPLTQTQISGRKWMS